VSWHLLLALFPLAEHRHVHFGEQYGAVQWGLRTLSEGLQLACPIDSTLGCEADTTGGVGRR